MARNVTLSAWPPRQAFIEVPGWKGVLFLIPVVDRERVVLVNMKLEVLVSDTTPFPLRSMKY